MFSEYYYSVKSSGVNEGFVITQYKRDNGIEINSVVVDDTSIVPQTLLNDEFHNYLNHYKNDSISIKKLPNTTIYTAYYKGGISCVVTIDTDGTIAKVEEYDKVVYDKHSRDSFDKVVPQNYIIPSLLRYILFTRCAPRGKYFSSIFIGRGMF